VDIDENMTAEQNGFSGSEIGGASGSALSTPQICQHRGHYEFKAKRLVYRGLGSYDYVFFTVYSHHRKYSRARDGSVCIKSFGVYEVLGMPEENDLILVRPVGE